MYLLCCSPSFIAIIGLLAVTYVSKGSYDGKSRELEGGGGEVGLLKV